MPVAVLLAPPVHAQEAMFRGDAARRGVFDGVAVPAFGGVQWRVRTGGPVRSSPAIAGGTAYVGSSDGSLYAIDAARGTVRWSRALDAPIASSPAVANGLVFVIAHDGALHALRTDDGSVAWRYRTGAPVPLTWGHESGELYDSSPVVADGLVLVGAADGRVHALRAATGAPRWTYDAGSRVYSSPAVANGTVVVGAQDGWVHAIALGDGTRRWRFASAGTGFRSADFGFDRTTVQSSPAIVNGTVYVGARDGFHYAIDVATGKERWRNDHRVSWVNASAAVDGGVVYTASSDGHFVQAVEAATGAERWRAATVHIVWASPAIDRELLYVGEGNGTLYALERATGKERWRWRADARILSSAALSNGMLVVGSDDGSVYALRASPGASMHRAVFFDSATAAKPFTTSRPALRDYLVSRGYQVLDAAALARFLDARVRDREPSTVVFAVDRLPPEVAPVAADTVLVRRYLDTGGTVVWAGNPPMMAPPGFSGLKDLVRDAPTSLLGVRHPRGNFDPLGVVRVTDAGTAVGMRGWWLEQWGADPASVTEVLAYDEDGQAVAWRKAFGGPPGTGFVRLFSGDGTAARPHFHDVVQTAAELRPAATR